MDVSKLDSAIAKLGMANARMDMLARADDWSPEARKAAAEARAGGGGGTEHRYKGVTTNTDKHGITEHKKMLSEGINQFGNKDPKRSKSQTVTHHPTGEVFAKGEHGHMTRHGNVDEAAKYHGWEKEE